MWPWWQWSWVRAAVSGSSACSAPQINQYESPVTLIPYLKQSIILPYLEGSAHGGDESLLASDRWDDIVFRLDSHRLQSITKYQLQFMCYTVTGGLGKTTQLELRMKLTPFLKCDRFLSADARRNAWSYFAYAPTSSPFNSTSVTW